MKKWMTLLIITFFFTTALKAADLKISGVVYRSLSISYGQSLSLGGNGDMIIDIENTNGKIKRHYFESNSRENYGKSSVKKITIYAP